MSNRLINQTILLGLFISSMVLGQTDSTTTSWLLQWDYPKAAADTIERFIIYRGNSENSMVPHHEDLVFNFDTTLVDTDNTIYRFNWRDQGTDGPVPGLAYYYEVTAEKSGETSDPSNLQTAAIPKLKLLTSNLDFVASHAGLDTIKILLEYPLTDNLTDSLFLNNDVIKDTTLARIADTIVVSFRNILNINDTAKMSVKVEVADITRQFAYKITLDLIFVDLEQNFTFTPLVTDKTAKLKWNTNVSSQDSIYYRFGQNDFIAELVDVSVPNKEHEIELTNLEPDTVYEYRVVSITGARRTESSLRSFRTQKSGQVDIEQSFDLVAVTDTTAFLQWETNIASRDSIYYGTDTNYGNAIEVDSTGPRINHDITLRGLIPGIEYHYHIISTATGSPDKDSGDRTFTTQQPQGIVQSAWDVAATQNSATITWQTNLATQDTIYYGLDPDDYIFNEVDPTGPVTEHMVELTNLVSDTLYYYRVSSAFGNSWQSSGDRTFRTERALTTYAYPSPFVASNPSHTTINFTNLPTSYKIALYNFLGEPVFKTDLMTDPEFQWDVKNNAQKEISSGMYIYYILDKDGNKIKSGKLVIVR